MSYQIPTKDYDWTTNGSFQLVIANSGGAPEDAPDEDLISLLKKTHRLIDYVYIEEDGGFLVPLTNSDDPNMPRPNQEKVKIFTIHRKFETIEDVIEFVLDEGSLNYFFQHSFKNLTLSYSTLSLDYDVNGLSDQRKFKLRNKKIDRLLLYNKY